MLNTFQREADAKQVCFFLKEEFKRSCILPFKKYGFMLASITELIYLLNLYMQEVSYVCSGSSMEDTVVIPLPQSTKPLSPFMSITQANGGIVLYGPDNIQNLSKLVDKGYPEELYLFIRDIYASLMFIEMRLDGLSSA